MIAHLISSASTLPTDSSALVSAISALESSIEALERSSERLEPWIPIFTGLVALGVALEIWVVLVDHKAEMDEWHRSLLHPEKPSARKLWVEIFSIILVTVGILGELGVGLGISSINGQLRAQSRVLRSKSDQLLALVTKEAVDANERAEELKAENLRLEAIIAPRSLSRDQQKRIADACKEFHGHNVLLSSYAIDGEAAALGGQIISLLRSVGITVVDNRGRHINAGGFDVGIHIRNQTGANTENDFTVALRKALSTIGKLKVSVNDPFPPVTGAFFGGGPAFPPGTVFVDLMVGIKPLPVLPATTK